MRPCPEVGAHPVSVSSSSRLTFRVLLSVGKRNLENAKHNLSRSCLHKTTWI